MKLHKTCVCGVHTHVNSKYIVDNKCPACGTEYTVKEKSEVVKVKREPTEKELTMTEGQQGYKPCGQTSG
jgi:adenine-specific DNA methylase